MMPIKIPNITTLINISFATILMNILAKQVLFILIFVNLDKKTSKWFTDGENHQGQKLSKLWIVEETIGDSNCYQ